jgi:hypothetical protein
MRVSAPNHFPGARQAGFARVEFLSILFVVATLTLLQIAGATTSKGKSSVAVCFFNLRQLTQAWQMYADDNKGALAENFDSQRTWVTSIIDYSNPQSANTANLTNTPFGRYVGRTDVYRCPADESSVRSASGLLPRNRSYSMNGAVGNPSSFWLPTPPYRSYTNLVNISAPPPSRLSIFLEEHPDSINDGMFAVQMPTSPGSTTLIDFPAAYHDGAMSLSCADGHVEMKRWLDPRTSPPVRLQPISLNIPQPNNPDVLWLAERTSSRLE